MSHPMFRRFVRELPYLILCAIVLCGPMAGYAYTTGKTFTDILWR